MRSYKPKADRQADIIDAAIECAKHANTGVRRIKREDIAQRVGVSAAAISYHFSTMDQLKRAVYRAAVKREELRLIAQGIVERNTACIGAPAELRTRALATLV